MEHQLYQSKQRIWEQRACVRHRPRIILENPTAKYFYPIERVPIALHPSVQACGEEVTEWLLIQSLYKYLHDIALVETNTVVNTCLKLINNNLQYELPGELLVDLMAVVVDEGYHAYIAMDYARQVEKVSRIAPVKLPSMIELTHALQTTMRDLDTKDVHAELEYIAVCIAENTITKDLATIKPRDNVTPEFYTMIADHMLDEGRHSMVFTSLLTNLWQQIDTEKKTQLIDILPTFIDRYLDISIQQNFDRQLLNACDLPAHHIEKVLEDSYKQTQGDSNNPSTQPMRINIDKILSRAGIVLTT